MDLTRRDALTALGGLGLAATALFEGASPDTGALDSEDIECLVALSETLYPSHVAVKSDFIETYVAGQRELDPQYTTRIASALLRIRQASKRQTGRPLTDLGPTTRGEVLRSMGVARAYPDPEGTDVQRTRYYIVNNLLYALYTTPKGAELVGNPNPPGHPGGTNAYQGVSTDE